MFNKEENKNITKIKLQNNVLYKQYNNISITPSFMVMLNNYYESKIMENHLDYDQRLKLYNDKVFTLSMKKQYNNVIVDFYHNGKLSINNNLYSVRDFYIVYQKDTKNYQLLCTNPNYDSNVDSYDTSIKFIDTTAFINLIRNNEIIDNTITIEDNELQNTVKSWDGLIHNETSETEAIIRKDMLGD